MVPTGMSSNQLIQNAKVVFTIIGTTGWEAIIRNKPVITMEENMSDVLDLSVQCKDLRDISNLIYSEQKRIEKISQKERKRRLICFLAAIHHTACWIDEPLKVFGEVDCDSIEDANEIGSKLSKNLINFLNNYPQFA